MFRINLMNKITFFLFFLFFSHYSFSKSLKFEGLNRLSIDDLQAFSEEPLKSNNFDDQSVNELIKSLLNSDLFYEVDLKKEDNFFIINLVENYIIKEIYFNNNVQIKNQDLFSVILSKKNDFINKDLVRKDENIIKDAYRTIGYKDTIVKTQIEFINNTNVNLIFDITENLAYKIRYIDFYGNDFFSARYLRARINSKPVKPFNIFTTGSNFNYSLIKFDINKIKNLYDSYGFLDAKVSYSLVKNLSDFKLQFMIKEQERYKVSSIDITYPKNDNSLKKDIDSLISDINKKISKNDQYYNLDTIKNYANKLNDILFSYNYKDSIYKFDVIASDNKTVKILFFLEETPKYIVNKINLFGNSITKDKTIRSKLSFEPGDIIYNTEIFTENTDKLNKEKYINNSNISYSIKEKSTIDIDLEVEENKKTGNLFIAGGYDGDDGANVQLGISDNNILGTGNSIDSTLSLNTDNIFFDIGITQKPLFNPNLKIRYSLFNQENDLTGSFGFKSKRIGLGIGFDTDINKELSNSITIKYLNLENTDPKNNSSPLMANIGDFNKLTINYTIVKNTTNDIFYPSSGKLNKLSFEISPDPFLSDFSYLKVSANNNFYFKRKESDSNFFILSSIDLIESLNNENLNTVDMFSLGGRDFNGYEFRGIGPKDSSLNYLGGKKKYTFKIGYSSSFIFDKKDNIRFNNYFNFGSLWDNDFVNSNHELRSSFTSSLDFLTPIGPISFSYSVPILKEDGDNTNNFAFSIGTSF